MKRSFVAAAACTLIALGAAPGQAQVDLEWSAPPECAQEQEVRARLRTLVGPSLERISLRAQGVVEKTQKGYRLRLRVLDAAGERTIEAESCTDLVGAATVALVFLMHEAEATIEVTEPAETEVSPSRDAEQRKHAPAPPVEPDDYPSRDAYWETTDLTLRERETAEREWGAVLQAPVSMFEWGPLPEPSLGLALGAGLERNQYRLVLRGEFGVPLDFRSDVTGVGARLQRASVAAIGCRGWSSERLEFSPCLLVALEHVSATGTGPAVRARSDGVFWLAPGAEGALRVHVVDWIALFVAISGRLATAHPRITVQGLGEVAQVGPVGVSVLLGLEWFP